MRLLILGGCALALSACAFGDEKLNVGYTPEMAKAGLLSEAPATRIDVADVTDERQARKPVGKPATAEPKRPILVGYKRNGFGQDTGNIVAEQPVADIVEAALETMLAANGHEAGTERDDLALNATLQDFWFDYKTGMVTIEYTADVVAEVTLTDRRDGQELFSDTFVGSSAAKQAGGTSKTWTRVTNEALADMVRQVSLSAELMEAIEEADEAGAGPMARGAPLGARTGS